MPSLGPATRAILRPPGCGITSYSAGKSATESFLAQYLSKLLGIKGDPVEIWERSLEKLSYAKIAMLGAPCDVGAGIRRGAAGGPRAIREAIGGSRELRSWAREGLLVDIGDLFVNPHLLDDELLSQEAIHRCQDAMYPMLSELDRRRIPVSPLSQLRRVLESLFALNRSIRPFILGGDHSVAWPVTQALFARYGEGLAIVQPDAHTDLLPSRLGVPICFGTWSYHANRLLGGKGRLVQLGIRESGHLREHWESSAGVKQFWASELLKMPVSKALDAITEHLKSVGAKKIYFSNDIDGTDAKDASATGTPAKAGLSPKFVLSAIKRLSAEFEWVGADLVEVAPDLGPIPSARKRTLETAGRYAIATIKGLLIRGSS